MIFKIALFWVSVLALIRGYAGTDTLRYTINLNEAENGVLTVKGILPTSPSGAYTWQMPAIVPGTYKIYDFGRFITNFSARPNVNASLEITHPNPNQFVFQHSKNTPINIQYQVNQTKGFEDEGKSIFDPAGTFFKKKEVFLLNTFAIMGYIQDKVQQPIRLQLILPDSLHASTAQDIFRQSEDTIEFVYANYHEMADQPILVCKPETAVLRFNDTQVLISVYDPEKKAPAGKIAEQLKRILDAQQLYLGGKLPVKNYAFLIFIDPDFNMFGGFGALEHNYSSVYYLPSLEPDWIYEQIRDIGAHEFFHIITPLTIHSEQIQHFNFEKPEMSRHLWLYEGVTEYASHLVQIQYDIKTEKEFLETIREKILETEEYNPDISMIEMSLGCLDSFENEYQSVYSKGALVGMCLDLILRQHMPDHRGLADLMQRLSTQFGKDRAFPDSALFQLIEQNSVPQAGEFLREYVGKARSLPLLQVLESAGYYYFKEKTVSGFTLGGIELGINPETGRLTAWETHNMDKFGKKIGFKAGDEFFKVNGQELTMDNLENIFTQFFANLKEGDWVEFQLIRPKGKKGKTQIISRKAKMVFVEYPEQHVIEAIQNPSPAQIQVRKAWLNRLE
jgi:predicted metalloprotease with PDZ domain